MEQALRPGPIKLVTLENGKITNPTAEASLLTLPVIFTKVNGSTPKLMDKENS